MAQHLGFAPIKAINKVIRTLQVPVLNHSLFHVCGSCQYGKSHRLSFSSSCYPLDLIYSDVWGPSPYLANNKFLYYVLFLDDFSKYFGILPMKAKHEVFDIFLRFKSQIENLFERKINVVRSGWGGEYQKCSKFFAKTGIIHRVSCPYTHEQNGFTERKHRHVIETRPHVTCSCLNSSSLLG